MSQLVGCLRSFLPLFPYFLVVYFISIYAIFFALKTIVNAFLPQLPSWVQFISSDWIAPSLIVILNFADWHSTSIGMERWGTKSEFNPLFKKIMDKWGMESFRRIKLGILPIILIFWLLTMNDQERLVVLLFFLFIVINNYTQWFISWLVTK